MESKASTSAEAEVTASEEILKMSNMLESIQCLEKEEDEQAFISKVQQLFSDFDLLKEKFSDPEVKRQIVLETFEILESAVSSIRIEIEKKNTADRFSLETFRKNLCENVIGTGKPNWAALESACERIFKPNICFKTLNQPPPKVAKETKKAPRERATEDTSQTQSTQPIRITEENREKTEANRANRVLHCLEKEYKGNGNKSVPYLNFVLDPDSFSRTISNIFTVSLLVKDNLVLMSTDENNSLLLKPIVKNKQQNDGDEPPLQKNHMIVSLNYDLWEKLVRGLNLKEAAIPP